jgi:hypothetical protein
MCGARLICENRVKWQSGSAVMNLVYHFLKEKLYYSNNLFLVSNHPFPPVFLLNLPFPINIGGTL